jgi:O-antigen ligase
MHVWSQFISLGLAALAFILALPTRHYQDALAPRGNFRLIMWPKLLRFPLFWLGLFFLSYVLIQALNPAWVYIQKGNSWWLEPIDYIAWLPAGMTTPFADTNPWRELMIYGSAWLLTCALWVGITRRAAVQRLFTVVVINGALLALVGILQRVTHAQYILWGLKDATTAGGFFATIIYKNHAGAYFNLVLMICIGLLYWHFAHAERSQQRASPAPVFAFGAILLGLAVLLSFSRAGTILMLAFMLIAFIGFVVRCALNADEDRNIWVTTLLCLGFASFIGLGAYFLKTDQAIDRLGQLIHDGKNDFSVSSRYQAREATLEMAKDNLITGWGAGSFRHYFPVYQRHYPEIYKVPGNPTVVMRWEFAHNDYVQLLAELGLIGAALILSMLIAMGLHFLQQKSYLQPHLMLILLGLLITTLHAWVDFQFHNPAILFLWCASIALLGRWAEFEHRRT